ncbi:Protein max [Halotydeus destructor]|nr:Protein max [Halotydeus destructor]
MTDDERDVDIESDEDDVASCTSGNDSIKFAGSSQARSSWEADKRAHHNALERKRRDHIKDSFSGLRDSVPSLQGEKVKSSRAQILKKAAEYIQMMRRKNSSHQQDIDDLKRQNKILEEQIRTLDKAKSGGFTSISGTSTEKPNGHSISSLDLCDSENSDSELNGSGEVSNNSVVKEEICDATIPLPASKRLKTASVASTSKQSTGH